MLRDATQHAGALVAHPEHHLLVARCDGAVGGGEADRRQGGGRDAGHARLAHPDAVQHHIAQHGRVHVRSEVPPEAHHIDVLPRRRRPHDRRRVAVEVHEHGATHRTAGGRAGNTWLHHGVRELEGQPRLRCGVDEVHARQPHPLVGQRDVNLHDSIGEALAVGIEQRRQVQVLRVHPDVGDGAGAQPHLCGARLWLQNQVWHRGRAREHLQCAVARRLGCVGAVRSLPNVQIAHQRRPAGAVGGTSVEPQHDAAGALERRVFHSAGQQAPPKRHDEGDPVGHCVAGVVTARYHRARHRRLQVSRYEPLAVGAEHGQFSRHVAGGGGQHLHRQVRVVLERVLVDVIHGGQVDMGAQVGGVHIRPHNLAQLQRRLGASAVGQVHQVARRCLCTSTEAYTTHHKQRHTRCDVVWRTIILQQQPHHRCPVEVGGGLLAPPRHSGPLVGHLHGRQAEDDGVVPRVLQDGGSELQSVHALHLQVQEWAGHAGGPELRHQR